MVDSLIIDALRRLSNIIGYMKQRSFTILKWIKKISLNLNTAKSHVLQIYQLPKFL
jgi:hypothetical protein